MRSGYGGSHTRGTANQFTGWNNFEPALAPAQDQHMDHFGGKRVKVTHSGSAAPLEQYTSLQGRTD